MRRALLILGLLAGLLFVSSGPAAAQTEAQADAFIKIMRGTVIVQYVAEYESVLGETVTWTQSGSGVLVAQNKVLTCYHIGSNAPPGEFVVRYFDGERTLVRKTAAVLRKDKAADLLLLSFDPPIKEAEPICLAPAPPSLGDDIVFTGHTILPIPRLRFGKYIFHLISGISLHPVYRGDSGGGVYTMRGDLVGLIHATVGLRDGGGTTQTLIGHAIPWIKLRDFLKGAL